MISETSPDAFGLGKDGHAETGRAQNSRGDGGKWAPAVDYGQSIVRDYLTDMLATEEQESIKPPEDDECSKCQELEDHIDQLDALLDKKEKKIHALEASMRLIVAEGSKHI
ncbi:hypothetical protein [Candidatus Contubernalis alkaliaceticus]|uniref:hypothetical protein n=1 Tax=Candidatus Contubernalis alkaliaceticus TaxID=338645 RepID=UPI001F4BF3D1|nr:hypothetical protein [Candidatus Contubernalis alkalaceticus]UNC91639.1 hypothetical protein HUE98_05765 [Candidatus Contubernalis alkalaceticus]